ncbi:MAG: hypothetical protein H6Q15_1112 [Bacteroidetes bacterium]|nr:hypothetical protein [Bacteroidota bacterium]
MRKHSFLIVFAILIFANTSIAQLPQNVPTNGLVGWWGFNGNANDGSTNGNNGIVNGTTLTTDRNGMANSAYYFNGNSNITIAHNSGFLCSNYSLCFWAKYNTNSIDNNGGQLPGLIGKGGQTTNGKVIIYESLGVINTQNDYSSGTVGVASTSIPYNDNNWHFFVFTYQSGDTIKAFVDGVYNASVNINSTFVFNNVSPLKFGRVDDYYFKSYTGYLDDVGFWNRSLTQQEVLNLYNGCTLATPIINPLSSTSFCQGGSVQLMSSEQNSSYSYSWYLNNNIINGANQTVYTANTAGNYTLKVDAASCSKMSNPVTVSVNSLPSVSVYVSPFINIQNSQVNIIGNPSGGIAYGNGVTGMLLNPETAGLGNKSILYTYVDANGCSATATASTIIYDTIKCYVSVDDTLIINTNVGFQGNANITNQIKIYPNPAKTNIIIDNGNYNYMNGYSIQIYNTAGQMVYNQPINQQLFNINISTLTGKGLYYLKIIDSTNTIIETKKIVVQ